MFPRRERKRMNNVTMDNVPIREGDFLEAGIGILYYLNSVNI